MNKGRFANKPTLNIPKKLFFLGLFIGIGYTILFYFFLVGCREMWRYFSTKSNYETFLFLNNEEIIFYNFFFAFVSCLTGFTIVCEFWLRSVRMPNYIRLSIQVDQKSLQWFTNHLFFKLAVFFGIFCTSVQLFESFEFYTEYRYLFCLLMIVLFGHQWMRARLFFGNGIIKHMAIIGTIELLVSLALAFIPLNHNQRMNDFLLKQSPKYYCTYELPTSTIAYGILRKQISSPLFIGFSTQKSDSTILVSSGRGGIRRIGIVALSTWVQENRESLDEMEYGQMLTELFVDKRIKMKQVKEVLMELRKSDVRRVHFMANKYEVGLPFGLRPLCEEIYQPDTRYQPPNMPCDEMMSFRGKKIVSLELESNVLLYNGQKIEMGLIDSIKFNVKKFAEEIVFELYVDDVSHYETFVKLYEDIWIAYQHVWQETAKSRFGLTLSGEDLAPSGYYFDLAKEVKEIRGQYPINLIMWSDEEIEHFNLRKSK